MKYQAAALCAVFASLPLIVQGQAAYRTLHVKISEVTAPDVAVSTDGDDLIFSALGHLQSVPVNGGDARQLTFGAAYDSGPVVSPDGTRVAFISNRDGSSGNIFVLDLATHQVSQVSHEISASKPAWSPDSKTIAYTRDLPREDHPMNLMPGFGATANLFEIRTVSAAGGTPEIIGEPRTVGSLFYLPDGRLAWTERVVSGRGMFGAQVSSTSVKARAADGSIETLASAKADLDKVVLGPKGDGLYYAVGNKMEWLSFAGANPVAGPVAEAAIAGFAVGGNGHAYFGSGGQLWSAELPAGSPHKISFTAMVEMDVRPTVHVRWAPPPTTAAEHVPMRPELAPALAPDGSKLMFMAGGFIWEQPLVPGASAKRLFDSGAFMRGPVFSPDGSRLAYIAEENGKRDLRVLDFDSGKSRTLYEVGGASWPLFPNWSHDGQRIVFQHSTRLGGPFEIIEVNVQTGETTSLAQTVGSWIARPQFSKDGDAIYYTNRPGKFGTLYRLKLEDGAKPEALTDLTRHVHEGLVSPDGHWLAFKRNSEIWIASMANLPIHDSDLKRLSTEGGRGFSFAPDSSAVIYTETGHVWRQPIDGAPRTEIMVRANLPRDVAAPLLISNVHVLDLDSGQFSDATSMLVRNDRIAWIGSAQGHDVPGNTVRMDAGGRYAIPGLFDVHVHSAWANQQANPDAFIAFGVTSVRDTGGKLALLNALDDRSNITDLPVPRYFYSGEIQEGLMPLWGDAFNTIGTAQEARREVRHVKAAGGDFIKIYPSVPWYVQGVISDEAHRIEIPIVGHGLSPDETIRRVIWGTTSIEHSTSVREAYSDIYAMLAAAGIPADLTLSVGGGALMRKQYPNWESDWRVQEYVPAASLKSGVGMGGGSDLSLEQLQQRGARQNQRIMEAHADGVHMNVGTDSMMTGVYFGLALHWELALFVDAGFKPIDALRMATEDAAHLVGASDDLGSLEPGKFGDVVLLDKNPLQDIHNTQSIWRVVKGGHVYDPRTMRAN